MRHRTCCRKNVTANPGSGKVTANMLEFVVGILRRQLIQAEPNLRRDLVNISHNFYIETNLASNRSDSVSAHSCSLYLKDTWTALASLGPSLLLIYPKTQNANRTVIR
jgi:hypothetical protein